MVGALTGNKKLSQIGGIVSLVGGIGGLATGAWSTAADGIASDSFSAQETFRAGELGGTEATNAAMGASGMDVAADAGLGAMDAGGAALSGTSPVAAGTDMLSSAGSDAMPDVTPDAAETVTGGQGETALPAANAAPTATGQTAGTNAYDPAAQTPTTVAPAEGPPGSTAAVPDAQATSLRYGGGKMVDPASAASDSFWGKAKGAMEWMNQNPNTTKLASGMLQGAMSAYSRDASIDKQFQMQAQARADDRARLNASLTGPNGKGLMIPKWRPSTGAGG